MTRVPSAGPLAGSWGGLDDLRREMDALFSRFGAAPGGPSGVFPPVNLYEASDGYVLTAELPGLTADDVEVSLEGSTVTLRGERSTERFEDEEVSLHRRERQSGRFQRAFELPCRIDGDKVEAVHKNGILMLRLPKAPEPQPRQIRVRAS